MEKFPHKYYGFRGEAICSLQDVCLLDIVTRPKGSPLTFTKTMKQGQALNLGTSVTPRACGTSITCHNIFFSMPVRRRNLTSTSSLSAVRHRMEAIALACPYVSISLFDEHSGFKLLHTTASPSSSPFETAMKHTFTQLFGFDRASCLKPFSVTEGSLSLRGLFSTEFSCNTNFQVRQGKGFIMWKDC